MTNVNGIEIPDEYGLSSDSLRGSYHFVQPHLVNSEDSRDPLTGRPNPRATLSQNEILALEHAGILVDADGYEREPEPVEQIAPIPTVQPRVRPQDRAPVDRTEPQPPLQIPVDESDDRPIVDKGNPLNPTTAIPPYGGTEAGTPVAPHPADANPPSTSEDGRTVPPTSVPPTVQG